MKRGSQPFKHLVFLCLALLLCAASLPLPASAALTSVVTIAGSGSSLQSRFLYQAMDTLMRRAKASALVPPRPRPAAASAFFPLSLC